LNDYVSEGLEKGVPPLEKRIQTFKTLVDVLGKGHVIWRFDPLILTDTITPDVLLKKIENIGDQLKGYTEKLVFSFADIEQYKKVKNNLIRSNIRYTDWTEQAMSDFAMRLSRLNAEKGWNYELATCGEKPVYKEYGIQPNHCVDDLLMIRFAWKDQALMKFLGVDIRQKNLSLSLFDEPEDIPDNAIVLDDGIHYAVRNKDNRDKGQRTLCGCMVSKDIGQYDTCPHQCEYCYANTSKETALANYMTHMANPYAETITGK
jgi:DNA repair photolyase